MLRTDPGALRQERLELLDPIRGFAACWVFAFHLPRHESWDAALPALAAFFSLGHLGVPVFFAVSGLVITSAAWQRGPASWRRVDLSGTAPLAHLPHLLGVDPRCGGRALRD